MTDIDQKSSRRRKFRRVAKYAAAIIAIPAAAILLSIPAARLESTGNLPKVERVPQWILSNVQIVDVEAGKLIPGKQLLIENGRIKAIQPEGDVVAGATVIDGGGGYLTPGLTDMHVHIYDRQELAANLAYGVTSVRNLRGFPMHLRWRGEVNDGKWLGATMYTSSPVLDGPQYAHAWQEVVENPDQAREHVKRYKAAGYDLIKAYGYLNDDTLLAVLDQAEKSGIPVAKHGPAAGKLPLSVLRSVQSLEHVEDIFQGPLNFKFDDDALDKYISELKPLNIWITPTLATFNHLTELSAKKQDYIATLPVKRLNGFFSRINYEFTVKRWLAADKDQVEWNEKERAFLMHIVRKLDQAGIRMLVGSDVGTMYMVAGISTHDEMQLMQKAGLSPATVLAAATINPATAMRKNADYGNIADGKYADLLLAACNPLEDVKCLEEPVAVVKHGQYLNRQRLDEILSNAENTSGWYFSMGRFLEDQLARWWNRTG